MEARLGKAAVARMKAALVDASNDAKIQIKSVADFHARFSGLARR